MIHSLLSNDLAIAIAWTLVHTLWQITLVAILLALTLKMTTRANAIHRYTIGMASLFLVVIMSLITFAGYYMGSTEGETITSSVILAAQEWSNSTSSMNIESFFGSIENYAPLIINLWVIGALLFLLKIAGGFIYMNRLVKRATATHPKIEASLSKLREKFRIDRIITIKESTAVLTPMVMGYMKPIVLFPVGLINHLSTSEVEAILAHELAHIKRHDFLFNILQMIVEAIFYYHPGIWYISSKISEERENCCDDLAIQNSGSSISYAKTLVKLQDLKTTGNLMPALSVSGKKNVFTQRILRILNQSSVKNNYKDKLLAIMLVFASLLLGANDWNAQKEESLSTPDIYYIDDCPQSPDDIKYYLDTIPERNSFHIKKMTDDKAVEMEMENGKITSLTIDGVEVKESEYDKHKDLIHEMSPNFKKDIITIFPNCDDELGRVYLLESLYGNTIKMDSMLKLENLVELRKNNNNWLQDNYEVRRFNEELIDSIRTELKKEFPYKNFKRHSFKLDSILDLFPQDMSKLRFYQLEKERENVEKERANEEIILELKNYKKMMEGSRGAQQEMEKELNEAIRLQLKDKNYDIILRENLTKDLLKNNEDIIIELKRSLESDKAIQLERKSRENMERDLRELERFDFRFPLKTDIESDVRLYFETNDEGQNVFKRNLQNQLFPYQSGNKVSDHLLNSLIQDGLIETSSKSEIELTHKFLKINGDKQPENIFKKYKNLYQSHTGLEVKKGTKLKFALDPEQLQNDRFIEREIIRFRRDD